MTWPLWIALFGAAASGMTLAASTYWHWSYRWKLQWLGIWCEVSLAAFIFFLGCVCFAALLGHMP